MWCILIVHPYGASLLCILVVHPCSASSRSILAVQTSQCIIVVHPHCASVQCILTVHPNSGALTNSHTNGMWQQANKFAQQCCLQTAEERTIATTLVGGIAVTILALVDAVAHSILSVQGIIAVSCMPA